MIVLHLSRADPESQSLSDLLFIAVRCSTVNVSVPTVQSSKNCLLHLRTHTQSSSISSHQINPVRGSTVVPVLGRSSMCRGRQWASSALWRGSRRRSWFSSEDLTEEKTVRGRCVRGDEHADPPVEADPVIMTKS